MNGDEKIRCIECGHFISYNEKDEFRWCCYRPLGTLCDESEPNVSKSIKERPQFKDERYLPFEY